MNDKLLKRYNDPIADDDLVNKRYVDEHSGSTVVDSGSNENGSWTKWEDGTMICYVNKSFLVDINTAWGNVYESAGIQLGSFPQPFIEKPKVTASCVSGTSVWVEALNATKTSLGTSWLMRPVSSKNVSTEISFIAIGRWK